MSMLLLKFLLIPFIQSNVSYLRLLKFVLAVASSLFSFIAFVKISEWIAEWRMVNTTDQRKLRKTIIEKNGLKIVNLNILPYYNLLYSKIEIKKKTIEKKRNKRNLIFTLLKSIKDKVKVNILLKRGKKHQLTDILLYQKGFFKGRICRNLLQTLEKIKGTAEFSGYRVENPNTFPPIYKNTSIISGLGIVKEAQGSLNIETNIKRKKDIISIKRNDYLTSLNFMEDLPIGSTVIYSFKSINQDKLFKKNHKKNHDSKREKQRFELHIGFALYIPISQKELFLSQTSKENNLEERYQIFNSFARSILTPPKDYKGEVTFTENIKNLLAPLFCSKNVSIHMNNENLMERYFRIALNLSTLFEREKKTPNLKPSLKSYSEGSIRIGHQMYRGEKTSSFSINLEDLKNHVGIIGRTGSGKSMLAKQITKEILQNCSSAPSIWVFDYHGEWTHFSRRNFRIISPGTAEAPLSVNIFDPIYDTSMNHTNFLSNLFKQILKMEGNTLSPQMERVLFSAIEKTVSNREKEDPIIFVENIWKKIQNMESDIQVNIKTFQALINRLYAFFTGLPGKVFWTLDTNIGFNNLSSQNVIFDLSGLSRQGGNHQVHALLVNVLLKYLLSFFYRKRRFSPSDKPSMFIILEEARWLIPWQRKESSAETTIIEDLTLLSRKYGVSLIFLNQDFQSLSKTALNNMGGKFILSGNSPENFFPLSKEARNYIHQMPRKEALVELPDSKEPTHIKVAKISTPNEKKKQYQKRLLKQGKKLREKYEPIHRSFNQTVKMITNGYSLNELEKNNLEKEADEIFTLCEKKPCDKLSVLKIKIGELFRSYKTDVETNLVSNPNSDFSKEILKNVKTKIKHSHIYRSLEKKCLTCGIINSLIEHKNVQLSNGKKQELSYIFSYKLEEVSP